MFAKSEMATDIISQLCFDADTIAGWIANVRARGTHLPIWIGMPGCVDYAKLVRISMKIGITRQFKPGRLLSELTPVVTDPASNVGGFHLYTFNEVARTERWRRQALERLAR